MKMFESFVFWFEFHWSFVLKGAINNSPALLQIMAWRCQGAKPLSEPMMFFLLTHICITRPLIVNSSHPSTAYMCQWTVPALVQVMACHLFSAKPLPEPVLTFVNWSLRNKLQWNLNRNTKLFIQENAFENVVCKMAAILSWLQWAEYYHNKTVHISWNICHSPMFYRLGKKWGQQHI